MPQARPSTYSVRHRGGDLIAPSAISMSLEGGRILGRNAEVRDARRRSVDEKLTPVVKQKAAVITDRYNELTLEFKGDYAVTFRAYDDGVAYRFATSFPGQITVVSEQAEFAFPKTTASISRRRRAFIRTRSAFTNMSP